MAVPHIARMLERQKSRFLAPRRTPRLLITCARSAERASSATILAGGATSPSTVGLFMRPQEGSQLLYVFVSDACVARLLELTTHQSHTMFKVL